MSKPKARTSALRPGAKLPKETSLSASSAADPKNNLQSIESSLLPPAGPDAPANGDTSTLAAQSPGDPASAGRTLSIPEKIKELVRLAQEQGYLTYGDINEAFADVPITAEELDELCIKLRNMEVEIVDQAEVDRIKQADLGEEEDKNRLDILDDPVRMYLKQMGQVPLLTREQEVEISKRIEKAENEVKRVIYSFGLDRKSVV